MEGLEEKLKREYKLIAFDLDGTLLDDKKNIPEEVKEAIMEGERAGKIMVISTGRNITEITNFRKVEAFRYAVAINGAYIYDLKEDKPMVTDPIPKESIDKLFSYLKENGVLAGAHSEEFYIDKGVLEYPEKHHLELIVDTLRTHGIQVPNMIDLYYSQEMNIYKVLIYLNSDEEKEETKQELNRRFGDEFEIVYSEGYALELSRKGVNKGRGLEYLCDYLGVDIKDTIAVGDNENDIEAIEKAGLGIAMGNALDEVKEIADVVVPTNEELGCKTAIEKYLLKK